ncbi:MAG: family 20 glycosylhydrolase [Candidatus Eisenbacteria bacterium]
MYVDGGPEIVSRSRSRSRVKLTTHARLAKELGAEGYRLSVKPRSVEVSAAKPLGLLYAVQTLRQLAWAGGRRDEWVLPCCEITDRPRFAWRGFMLDESRSFSGEGAVKRLLDAMALLKLNRFHWHLTDETAWRIEIRRLPKLAEVGALPRGAQRRAVPEFYTQQQIREIVSYARERGIVVVPEINMPGHAAAANRAYPEYSAGGSSERVVPTFNPANEATFSYLETILGEVADLFPATDVLHLGGDEVDYGWETWSQLPEVKELMARESLKDLRAVEAHFKRRMAAFVTSLGRKAGLWMEGVEQVIPADQVVLFWWRHLATAQLRAALERGTSVVLCPVMPCFFDLAQDASQSARGRKSATSLINSLQSVYSFPDSLAVTLPAEAAVLGIQANLWTTDAVTQESRDSLTFPRLYALAKAAWTAVERKDYAGFVERLNIHMPHLRDVGIEPYDPSNLTPLKKHGR